MKNDTKKEVIRIDAEDKILGRLATEIALVLQGKNNPDYAPNKEPNNVVIVSNVKKTKHILVILDISETINTHLCPRFLKRIQKIF